MRCHHYCNTVNCPECIRAFWVWAENHTNGRRERHPNPNPPVPPSPSFYVSAGRFAGHDHRNIHP